MYILIVTMRNNSSYIIMKISKKNLKLIDNLLNALIIVLSIIALMYIVLYFSIMYY